MPSSLTDRPYVDTQGVAYTGQPRLSLKAISAWMAGGELPPLAEEVPMIVDDGSTAHEPEPETLLTMALRQVTHLESEMVILARELSMMSLRNSALLVALNKAQASDPAVAIPIPTAAKVHTMPAQALRHRTQAIGLLVR